MPILPGFYWVKCRGILSGNEYIQVAKVYQTKKDGPIDCVFLEGGNFEIREDRTSANITHFSNFPIYPPEG
jgi:hypothetical protein